jgi:hypothetical protein
MSHLRQFFACIVLAIALIGCGSGGSSSGNGSPGPSADKAEVRIEPSSGVVVQGTTFTRTVQVKRIGDSYYAAFDVSYNPEVIDYVDVTEGPFFSRGGSDQTSIQVASPANEKGRLTLGLTRLARDGEVSGSGELLTFRFKAIGPGTTRLTFESPMGFRNRKNQEVTVDAWESAAITVQ